MPDFPSSRERCLWAWALVVAVAIYSAADLARMPADALRESGLLELTSNMFNVGMLLVGAMSLVHLSPTRSTFSRARTGGLRMEKDDLARILKRNPIIDRTAIDRSQQAAKQLAEVGVKLGGYRLEPALGGELVRSPGQSPVRKGQQG